MSEQQSQHPGPEESPHHLEQQRKENRAAIAALGVDPYGGRTTGLVSLAEARGRYDAGADERWQEEQKNSKAAEQQSSRAIDPRPVVKVAGRVVLKREGGKLIWMQLRDHTTGPKGEEEQQSNRAAEQQSAQGVPPPGPLPTPGTPGSPGRGGGAEPDLQIAISKKDCAAPGFDVATYVDLGDVVVVEGPLMKTRTGEVTIWASSLTVACKSVAPPPAKWQGLQDVELRYRRRYVDLYANPETMRTFVLRSKLAALIRRFLDERGFMEVDTPVLQVQAGGAAARPFMTHMNALGLDLFMRVAPELYLKRLLVGGMPRVFEWSRNFRNEGLDKTHNPEFTILELYEAFGDYNTMRELTEGLFRACARCVAAGNGEWANGKGPNTEQQMGEESLVLPFGELRIDYGRAFEVVKYEELFERALGVSMWDAPGVLGAAKTRGLPTVNKAGVALDPMLLVNELFDVAEELIDPSRPTFVIDYPAALCPLTRPKKDRPQVAERFELFIGGMEMANAYTELNDPDVQEAKFREQLAGIDEEESTFRTFDEDFVNALKVGMPPAGGLGIGIERLMMVLLDQRTIRDVLLFPMMKPVGG